jgi:prepilin-type N-terminal cleavage/methylation domain-containing protein
MSRRGFTLVEMSVALLVGAIALVIAFNAIVLLTRGERSTDRAATKALTDSRLMSLLLMDIRSSTHVEVNGDDIVIERFVAGQGGLLESKKVTWKTIKDPASPRVTRQVDGESRAEEFSYRPEPGTKASANATPVDAQSPVVQLKVEKLQDDVVFKTGNATQP